MSRKFKIERDYYEKKHYLYKKKHVEFEPGLTVLIGCNGSGKTTLIQQLNRLVSKDLELPCIYYNNLLHGGRTGECFMYRDAEFALASLATSEGEAVSINLQRITRQIEMLFRQHPDAKEYWIFFDSIDSGFSIDVIEDLKRNLFDKIFTDNPHKDVYIIAGTNNYELVRGEKCFDVVDCRYVNIKSYERYRNLILKSRECKNNRYKQ